MAKATWAKIDGAWKQIKNVWINVGGVWKQKVVPKGNIAGLWKEFISYILNWKLLIPYDGYDYTPSIAVDSQENSYFYKYGGAGGTYMYKFSPDGKQLLKNTFTTYIRGWDMVDDYIYYQDRGNSSIYRMSTKDLVPMRVANYGDVDFNGVWVYDNIIYFAAYNNTISSHKIYAMNLENSVQVANYDSYGYVLEFKSNKDFIAYFLWDNVKRRMVITKMNVNKSTIWTQDKLPESNAMRIIGHDDGYIYIIGQYWQSALCFYIRVSKATGAITTKVDLPNESWYYLSNVKYTIMNGYLYEVDASNLKRRNLQTFSLLATSDLDIKPYTSYDKVITSKEKYLYYGAKSGSSASKGVLFGKYNVEGDLV